MNRILASLLLFVLSLPVFAAPVPVTLTYPTKNTDGSTIPATGAGSIMSWRAEWGTCVAGAFGVKAGDSPTVAAPATLVTLNLTPGTYCIRSYVKNTFGRESGPTNVAQVTVEPPTPEPGTITVPALVAGANVAPVFRINADGSRGTAVLGFVSVGATCGTTATPVVYTYRGRPYRRVDPTTVKWWATTPTTSAAVACG